MLRPAASLAALLALTFAAAAQQTTPAVPLVPPGQTTAKATEPEKKPIYDEKADGKQQIAAALRKAKANNTRVLVQWGGNWCGWCVMLDDLFHKDKDIAKELLYEYEVVHVDAGRPPGKNMDLAQSYGAKIDGFPFLTILDADGKALVNQETGSLENKDQEKSRGHDPAAVLALLKKYQAPHLSASSILDDGLNQARKSGKTVFLHFGAPWCGWCHKLENWMDQREVGAILDKQFINIKIDTERTDGGDAMFQDRAGPKAGGIPWFAFVDDKGNVLADSIGPKGNVGFPYQPDEVAHFETMLRKAPGKLTDADIKALIASLNKIREDDEKKKDEKTPGRG